MGESQKGIAVITIMGKIQWLTRKGLYQTLPHNTYFPYLLQLRGRAKLNKAVQTIPLPTSDDDPKPGTICTVAGWGTTTNSEPRFPTALMEVNITVIKRQTCNDKNHYNGKPVITENMICAGATSGKKDSCNVSIFTMTAA